MNLIRQVKLVLFFQNDFMNPTSYEKREYFSDGSRDGLRIRFSIHKVLTSSPNESTIVISNMNPDNRKMIISQIQNVYAELYVCYQGQKMSLLAKGDLVKALPEKVGTENRLTLSFLDGATAISSASSFKSYFAGTPIKEAIKDLAVGFLRYGVVVDESKISVRGNISGRGFTTFGRTATILDRLANAYGFTWSIQDGYFQAYYDFGPKNEPGRRKITVSNETRNLIKATPELGEKFMQQIGMKIEAVLDAKCNPGDLIDLKSRVYPQYSGEYEAMNVDYEGDTFGQEWKMTVDSKTIVPLKF